MFLFLFFFNSALRTNWTTSSHPTPNSYSQKYNACSYIEMAQPHSTTNWELVHDLAWCHGLFRGLSLWLRHVCSLCRWPRHSCIFFHLEKVWKWLSNHDTWFPLIIAQQFLSLLLITLILPAIAATPNGRSSLFFSFPCQATRGILPHDSMVCLAHQHRKPSLGSLAQYLYVPLNPAALQSHWQIVSTYYTCSTSGCTRLRQSQRHKPLEIVFFQSVLPLYSPNSCRWTE